MLFRSTEDDHAGAVKIVMTGAASDPKEWQRHIGNKARRDLLAKRARDASDPLKLVIVRDMWLTGFDAPCMHTMYVDKPMQGHGLMQAIARVNRVFRDKPAGLIHVARRRGKAHGQGSAQIAGVGTIGHAFQVLEHPGPDPVGSAGDRLQKPSAPYDRGKGGGLHALVLQYLRDAVVSKALLIRHRGERLQLGGIVTLGLRPKALRSLEKRDLRAGGPGVDDKNLHPRPLLSGMEGRLLPEPL